MALKVCLLLAILVASTHALTVAQLKVPSQVDLREGATLMCEFNLGGEGLYSIKWYKGGLEFYRFMPDYRPTEQMFPMFGVNLSSHHSNMSLSVVRLQNLSFNSSGTYACEVSAEAPRYQTAIEKANMTVMALPDHDPLIEGVRTVYSLGDYVQGNCTSAPSKPAATLAWYINGNKAEDWLLVHYATHIETNNDLDLLVRSLGLRFQLFKQHFLGNDQKMNLSCMATIGERSWQRTVLSTLANDLTNQKLAQERQGNNVASTLTSGISLFSLIMTSHAIS